MKKKKKTHTKKEQHTYTHTHTHKTKLFYLSKRLHCWYLDLEKSMTKNPVILMLTPFWMNWSTYKKLTCQKFVAWLTFDFSVGTVVVCCCLLLLLLLLLLDIFSSLFPSSFCVCVCVFFQFFFFRPPLCSHLLLQTFDFKIDCQLSTTVFFQSELDQNNKVRK